ncbi:unnamed protein product [Rotaria sordida]|uniref:Uncharacterized protein n=1 Tax=Rotaria sordida TaxID=392033 RepID=A0A819JT96_9BILA|nr:unnamed protein product [Rotaria sordida]CAF3934771.1 unnamed protein product [Rotaria sordida]
MELLTYIYHPAVRNNISEPHVIDQPEAIGTYCMFNPEAKMLYDENRAEYEEIALTMVKKYSCSRSDLSIISLKFTVKKIILKHLDFDSAKINQLPLFDHLKEYLHSTLYRSKDTAKP